MIVPRQLTPVPLADLPDALDVAHSTLRGFFLSADANRVAIAQLKLEHGVKDGALHGVWCFNFGNHDAPPADRADPSVPLFETVPENEVDPHGRGYQQVHVRRAYPDAATGLVGYWSTLVDGFSDAYYALSSGDPGAFAAALKAAHYYTADEGVYARDLRALMPAAG